MNTLIQFSLVLLSFLTAGCGNSPQNKAQAAEITKTEARTPKSAGIELAEKECHCRTLKEVEPHRKCIKEFQKLEQDLQDEFPNPIDRKTIYNAYSSRFRVCRKETDEKSGLR